MYTVPLVDIYGAYPNTSQDYKIGVEVTDLCGDGLI